MMDKLIIYLIIALIVNVVLLFLYVKYFPKVQVFIISTIIKIQEDMKYIKNNIRKKE